eukprot:3037478-Rhodomonas_salina.1
MLPWSATGTLSIQTAWHSAKSLTRVERSRSGCRSPRGSPGFAKSQTNNIKVSPQNHGKIDLRWAHAPCGQHRTVHNSSPG